MWTAAAWWLLPLALVLAIGAGLATALTTGIVLIALAAAATAMAIVLTPAWLLLPAVILAGVGTALLRLQSEGLAETLGHGRVAALLAGLALAYAVARGINFRIPRLALVAVVLFCAAVLVSALVGIVNGRDPSETFSAVQREISQSVAPLLIALVAFARPGDRWRTFRALAILALVVGLLALVYWLWNSETAGFPGAVESLFEFARTSAADRSVSPARVIFPFVDTDPNSAAAIFAVLGLFSATPLFSSSRYTDRGLAVLVLAVTAGAVLATQSRMGMAFLPLAGLAYVLLAGRIPAIVRVLLAVSVVAVAAIALAFSQDMLAEDRQITADDDNFQSRVVIWGEAFEEFGDAPIAGYGLRHAAEPRYLHESLSVHNEYLQRLVDGGVVGGLAFISVLAIFGLMSLALLRRGGLAGAIGKAAAISMAPLLVSMMVIASWTGTPFLQVLSWAIFGVVALTFDEARRAAGDEAEAQRVSRRAVEPAHAR